MAPDHYTTLGLQSCSSTVDEIKKAFRTLAKKYHPDKNSDKNAEEMFKTVKAAYECLVDPQSRTVYDLQVDLRAGVV